MSTITENINRIQTAKDDIKSAINNNLNGNITSETIDLYASKIKMPLDYGIVYQELRTSTGTDFNFTGVTLGTFLAGNLDILLSSANNYCKLCVTTKGGWFYVDFSVNKKLIPINLMVRTNTGQSSGTNYMPTDVCFWFNKDGTWQTLIHDNTRQTMFKSFDFNDKTVSVGVQPSYILRWDEYAQTLPDNTYISYRFGLACSTGSGSLWTARIKSCYPTFLSLYNYNTLVSMTPPEN